MKKHSNDNHSYKTRSAKNINKDLSNNNSQQQATAAGQQHK
jgi:hypothetical protein